MKTCKKCNIEKELSEYYSHPAYKDGLQPLCKICKNKYQKQHRLDNKEYYDQKNKQWYLDNREHVKQCYLDNKEKYKETSRKWYLDNREHYNNRQRQWDKQRRQTDPLYKFSCNIRTLISDSFKRKGYKKNTKTELILGCRIDEFKDYIQSQFIYPMSFDNHGLVWEIDHVIPISSAKDENEIIGLNHYTNLKPLFKTTEISNQYGYDIIGNRNKGASIMDK
jgi:hypothetical protein